MSLSWVGRGLAAGAAGTTALNAVTYLDMVVRGRPASDTPDRTVEGLLGRAGLDVPGEGAARANRLAGLGPLSGIATGLGVGAVLAWERRLGLRLSPRLSGVLAGLAAMALTDGSMWLAGVSDPRTWSRTDWVSDLVPHLVFGVVTAHVLAELEGRRTEATAAAAR